MNLQYLQHQIRITASAINTYWQMHITYRFASIMWIVNGFITPFLLASIWITIRRHSPLPINEDQLITYYVLSIVVSRLTQTWSAEHLAPLIKEGDLAKHLIQPVSYVVPQLAGDIAIKAIRMLFLAPFFIGMFVLWQRQLILVLSPGIVVIFTIVIFLGYLINFFLETSIGLLSFWLEHNEGAYTMYLLLRQLFSGFWIPVVLMPAALAQISTLSPFRYMLSFPIEIITNQVTNIEIVQGLVMGTIWVGLSALLTHLLFRTGIKKFTAIGI